MNLPLLTLFVIPLKRTTEVDFDLKVKVSTSNHNSSICKRATCSRDHLCQQFAAFAKGPDQVPLQRIRDSVDEYLSVLSGFLCAPDDASSDSKLAHLIPFHWGPSIAPSHTNVEQNAFSDAANVLFNAAACYLNQAEKSLHISENRQEVEKQCYATCTEAAGYLQLAHQLLKEHVPRKSGCPVDATTNFMEAMQNLALGQAQELGFRRALALENDTIAKGGGRNPRVMLKLGHQCAKLYEEAHGALAVEPINTEEGLRLVKYLRLKGIVYRTFTYLSMALHCNQSDDNGAAMLCADHAIKLAKAAVEEAKAHPPASKALLDVCLAAKAEAEAKGHKFEKENDMVFHQRRPQCLPELLPPQVLARPKQINWPPASKDWDGKAYDEFVVQQPPLPSDVVPTIPPPYFSPSTGPLPPRGSSPAAPSLPIPPTPSSPHPSPYPPGTFVPPGHPQPLPTGYRSLPPGYVPQPVPHYTPPIPGRGQVPAPQWPPSQGAVGAVHPPRGLAGMPMGRGPP